VLSRAFLALLLLFAAANPSPAKTVTDSAGRTVEVPDRIEKVFAAGPPASVLLYMLKPEAMVGWLRPPRERDLPFLLESTHKLPELGRLTGRGDTVNREVLIGLDPDIIIDYGTISDTYRSLADRVQEQLGIPYLLIDGSFENIPASLALVGELLGVGARAKELSDYATKTFSTVDAVLAKVGEAERPRVYLARGPEGLETGAKGSITTAIIERAGGVNVVDSSGGGLINVSPEQVIAWAPDTIITLDRNFAGSVKNLSEWQTVPAVANGKVRLAPDAPFGFIDSPPGINRLVGLYWLLATFYGEKASIDLRGEVKAFYTLFYHQEPSDADLDRLLGG
jgi:iron complex transport system substrate-binding protein